MKTLVVDDDLPNRMLMHRFLSAYGPCLCVSSAAEAEAAFELAHRESAPFDCVFMDIMMPVKDGHQALASIREREKKLGITPGLEVKVVMISALDDTKNVSRSFFGGQAEAYMVKPVDLALLRATLREAKLIA